MDPTTTRHGWGYVECKTTMTVPNIWSVFHASMFYRQRLIGKKGTSSSEISTWQRRKTTIFCINLFFILFCSPVNITSNFVCSLWRWYWDYNSVDFLFNTQTCELFLTDYVTYASFMYRYLCFCFLFSLRAQLWQMSILSTCMLK